MDTSSLHPNLLRTEPEKLTFSRHALWRMNDRAIAEAEVFATIRHGIQTYKDEQTHYYDCDKDIRVIVDWYCMTVITVFRQYWAPAEAAPSKQKSTP